MHDANGQAVGWSRLDAIASPCLIRPYGLQSRPPIEELDIELVKRGSVWCRVQTSNMHQRLREEGATCEVNLQSHVFDTF